jgi:MFS family permease
MNRWLILAGYALVGASTQLLWITFAPITTESAKVLHTSAGNVSWLAAVFQLIYVVLALPAGRWLDKRFLRALSAGTVLVGVGGILRIVFPFSFLWQLVMQIVIAVGQPLVMNAITKLSAYYFPERERATAISVGTAGLFVGILLAMFSGPLLYDFGGMRSVLLAQGLFAVFSMLWLLAAIRTPPAYAEETPQEMSLGWLRRDPLILRMGVLIFLGFGIFVALSNFLQPILAFFDISDVESGDLLALMTLAGIIGAALLPPVIAARDRRRGLILFSLVVCGVALAALANQHGAVWLAVWLFVTGFFLLANLPIVLDWAELHVAPGRQGAAVGFLMMAGNAGGLVLVVIIQMLMGNPYNPLVALGVAVLVALPFAWGLPGSVRLPRRAGAD